MKCILINNLQKVDVSHEVGVKKKVILNENVIPHLLNFSQAYLEKGQKVRGHSHKDKYEVFLVAEGKGKAIVNNEEFLLKKGVCLVVDPLENHIIINESNEVLVLTYFGILK